MEKLYQVIGYEKWHTRLMITSRYPVSKEYIALLITDQQMMEIAFTVVALLRYSPGIYIDASAENPPYISM